AERHLHPRTGSRPRQVRKTFCKRLIIIFLSKSRSENRSGFLILERYEKLRKSIHGKNAVTVFNVVKNIHRLGKRIVLIVIILIKSIEKQIPLAGNLKQANQNALCIASVIIGV